MAVPTAVILSREIAVSALREFMSGKGKRGTVKVGMQGKVKTAFQMAAIIGLLLVPFHVFDRNTKQANGQYRPHSPGGEVRSANGRPYGRHPFARDSG